MQIRDKNFIAPEQIKTNLKKTDVKLPGDKVVLGENKSDETILMADLLKSQKAGPTPPIGTVMAIAAASTVAGTATFAIAGTKTFGVFGGIIGGAIGFAVGGYSGLKLGGLYCS